MKKEVIFISPWLWTDGKHVGMPTLYYTMQGFLRNGYNVKLVIGSNTEEVVFDHDGIKIYQFAIRRYDKSEEFDAFKSIYERRANKLLWLREKTQWHEKASSMLAELSAVYNPALIYAVSPMGIEAAKKCSEIPQIWRFMGVNLMSNEKGEVELSSILKHLFEYLSFVRLSRNSQRRRPLIVITDDGTRGDSLIQAMRFDYRSLFFSKNGVEDFSKKHVVPEDSLSNEHLQMYEFISKLRTDGVTVVISTNRFAEWKRNDLAIKTLETLVLDRKRKDVFFLFVGNGPLLNSMKDRVKDSVGNEAAFIGSVNRSTMGLWLGLSDIYISMMDLGQLGNTTFEACLYGLTPVLRNNGMTTVFFDKKSAKLVEDSDEAATAIEYLIDNPDVKTALGTAARNLILSKLGTWDERIDNEIRWIEEQSKGGL
ncbi:glycosyltransferase [Mesotoga sp. B105.6.4]|uniref:glycosyltransferase n=1 Tax=Mesotoga sp. B105.6.4 TaxID=1582224 RepID=UPI000CCC307C|nr:glycosyltransferase [Mesotoga sp. B105.6.4]PNS36986.1 hypothetical protein RJ60_11590 [Mesotoga sp. B105.6.4]